MNRRALLWVVGLLLVGVVALSGTGMALAWGHFGSMPWNAGPGSMMGPNGSGSMMGPNGSGSMMGPGGHGGMMGGQPGTTPQTTPATGVTQVQIVNFAFSPANMQVPAGTRVTWTAYGMMAGSADGHTFLLVGPDGRIRWRADYGGPPDYTMYIPVSNLIADIKAGMGT